MIFVDTNVFMYAVGRDHPLKSQARAVFERAVDEPGKPLVTSAEVLQELLHAYLPVNRMAALNDALELVARAVQEVWPIEPADVHQAVELADANPALGARDLIHLACCQRRGIRQIRTFDRALNAAFIRKT
ncbi:MAG: VapC toxin family PIN domain ribonuclease [Gammaproteobacteria bacterium HGW-Gammaproteobacteria-8]|nr:MAG: VapC toxin family PIN domain ribonuclease [Gammaproteobacteria bacterium HGW-Gammaproteobacteria-8]